jgi:hypothetical protein
VFQDDLCQASCFARHLLKKGWHFDPWDKKIRWATYMQQVAFTTALVVAYCRPFAQSRGAATLSMKLTQYNADEKELHEKLGKLRNSVYAHSQVELQKVHPISINNRATAIVTVPRLKLTAEETAMVLVMIRRTSGAIGAKLQSLIERVQDKA